MEEEVRGGEIEDRQMTSDNSAMGEGDESECDMRCTH